METWEAKVADSVVGIRFLGARKGGRGPWLQIEDLPDRVKSYLYLEVLPGAAGNVIMQGIKDLDELEEIIKRDGTDRFGARKGTQAIVWFGVKEEKKPRKIPANVPAIRNLEDLMGYFGADDANSLNGAIEDNTDCGAYISVQTPDGAWHHSGDDWSGITEIIAFIIGTIVEGSDAEINSLPFQLPVTRAEVGVWIREMEAQAEEIWKEANSPEEPEGPKDWSPTGIYPSSD